MVVEGQTVVRVFWAENDSVAGRVEIEQLRLLFIDEHDAHGVAIRRHIRGACALAPPLPWNALCVKAASGRAKKRAKNHNLPH